MRWGVFIVLGALFVAGAVLSLLQLRPDADPWPAVTLSDPAGDRHDLGELDRRVWVAAFGAVVPRGETKAALEQIAATIAPTPVVLFLPPNGAAAETLPRGVLPRAVESGSEAELARACGVDPSEVARLDGGLVLSSIDRGGLARVRHVLTAGETAAERQLLLDDVRFLQGLEARPRLHAILNGTSALLLTCGLFFVRRRKIAWHLACMVLAGLVTSGFLASYLYYHYHAGSVSYPGTGWSRAVYFGVLLSHTVLAAFVVPLAVGTYGLAAARRFRRHRGLARWTLPIWLYVSVTGVFIYWMLYV